MKEIRFKLADVVYSAVSASDELHRFFRDYQTEECPEVCLDFSGTKDRPFGMVEAYRAVSSSLSSHDAFPIHASALVVKGKTILFCAPSGTGKSTHVSLWLDQYSGDSFCLNDDKPFVRLWNGQPKVYGTPWQGRGRRGRNTVAPLSAVCFLERSPSNHITPLSFTEAFPRLLTSVFLDTDTLTEEDVIHRQKTVSLLCALNGSVRFYLLKVNRNSEAAIVARKGMEQILED